VIAGAPPISSMVGAESQLSVRPVSETPVVDDRSTDSGTSCTVAPDALCVEGLLHPTEF